MIRLETLIELKQIINSSFCELIPLFRLDDQLSIERFDSSQQYLNQQYLPPLLYLQTLLSGDSGLGGAAGRVPASPFLERSPARPNGDFMSVMT